MPDPISYYYRQPQSALGQGIDALSNLIGTVAGIQQQRRSREESVRLREEELRQRGETREFQTLGMLFDIEDVETRRSAVEAMLGQFKYAGPQTAASGALGDMNRLIEMKREEEEFEARAQVATPEQILSQLSVGGLSQKEEDRLFEELEEKESLEDMLLSLAAPGRAREFVTSMLEDPKFRKSDLYSTVSQLAATDQYITAQDVILGARGQKQPDRYEDIRRALGVTPASLEDKFTKVPPDATNVATNAAGDVVYSLDNQRTWIPVE